jgi:LacI family transcriptional regulator
MNKLPKIILAIESYRAFDKELLKGISQYAKEHGPWLFFHKTDDVSRSLSEIEKIKPDAIIVRVSINEKWLEKIPLDMPAVVLGSGTVYENRINITSNSQRIGQMAAEYLLSLGFKDFGFCSASKSSWATERSLSFTKAIHNAGFDVNYYSYTENDGFAGELTSMTEWIKSLPRPIGIMAANDDNGLSILEACKAINVEVPQQVAVFQ